MTFAGVKRQAGPSTSIAIRPTSIETRGPDVSMEIVAPMRQGPVQEMKLQYNERGIQNMPYVFRKIYEIIAMYESYPLATTSAVVFNVK